MMKDMQFGETPRRPTELVGFDFVQRIPSGDWPQTSDCIPACPAIDLRCSADMELRARGIEMVRTVRHHVVEDTAADSETRIAIEVLEAFLEVVARERQVSIQFDDELPVVTGQA